jgi:hypothetical protein
VRVHKIRMLLFITAVPITKLCAWGGTREEPGTLTQGAPVFPGSSPLGIEPKTPGLLVQDPPTRPIGTREEPGTLHSVRMCVFITAGPITNLSVRVQPRCDRTTWV